MDNLPRRELVSAHFLAKEYRKFRALFADELRLPITYEDWLQSEARNKRAVEFAGLAHVPVTVQYLDFLEFAHERNLCPTYAAVLAYAQAVHCGGHGTPSPDETSEPEPH